MFYDEIWAFGLTCVDILTIQAIAEDARLRVIVVRSRSFTKAVVITVVQERGTIDHGVLSHQTMIETRSGATVSNVS